MAAPTEARRTAGHAPARVPGAGRAVSRALSHLQALWRGAAHAVAESIRFGVWLLVEPQETFFRLKTRGSGAAALVVVVLALAVRVVTVFSTAFHFSGVEPWEVHFTGELVRIMVPFASWVVVNYAVTAVIYGEGTIRDIFIGSAYALVPYVLFAIPISLVTNVLTLGERALVDVPLAAVYLWTAALFVTSVKVIHNYEWRQALGISVLTVIGMLLIWAVGAMVYGLTDQVVHFVREVWREVLIR